MSSTSCRSSSYRTAIAVAMSISSAACAASEACPEGAPRVGRICQLAGDSDAGVGVADRATLNEDLSASVSPPMMATPAVPTRCQPNPSPDAPDRDGVDSNCDGIDGTIAWSIFVAPTGDDNAGDGSPAHPVATISRAIALAADLGRNAVLIGNAEYEDTITLVAGISLFGGYDARDGFRRDRSRRAHVRGRGPVITGTDVDVPTRIADLTIEAADAIAGESSIAVVLRRADAITWSDVEVIAGAGGTGLDGEVGRLGADGNAGGGGHDGVYSGASCGTLPIATREPSPGAGGNALCGCTAGGSGGTAGGFHRPGVGASTSSRGGPADVGRDCFIVTATAASPGEPADGAGGDGRDGENGRDGDDGASGTRGGPIGLFTIHGYRPANGGLGRTGHAGRGGAGGGGADGCGASDFCLATGGAGGGGGSGACGGSPGSGGQGGGASIGMFLWDSSPALERVLVRASNGGRGGDGGDGGFGGIGGAGGEGGRGMLALSCGRTGHGGRGGAGGNGGRGGAGGGGGGGPSVGVVLGGTSEPTLDAAVVIEVGAGGPGGGAAASGEQGATGAAQGIVEM